MKGPWKALAFLAAVAGTAFFLSASAFALGGGSARAPAQWRVKLGTVTWSGRLPALYPGVANDSEVFSFTVTNGGRTVGRLHSITVSISSRASGDAATANGADIRGCRTNWFAISVDPRDRALPVTIAPGAAYAGKVDLAMRNSGVDQDACRRAAPAFTVIAK